MDRRVVKTREAIQNAYFTLLAEDKTRITITEIAHRANIDRKTFYLHYDSIDDIVKKTCIEKFQELDQRLEQQHYFENPYDTNKLFKIFNAFLKEDISLYQQIALHPNRYFFWSEVENTLTEGIKSAALKYLSKPSEQIEVSARFCAAGIIHVYLSWFKGELDMTLEKLGDIISKFTSQFM